MKSIEYKDILDFGSKAVAKIPLDIKNIVDQHPNTYLAGGYFSSILNDEVTKDYDIFTNLEEARNIIIGLLKNNYILEPTDVILYT